MKIKIFSSNTREKLEKEYEEWYEMKNFKSSKEKVLSVQFSTNQRNMHTIYSIMVRYDD